MRAISEKINIDLNYICPHVFAKPEHDKQWAREHTRHTRKVRSVTGTGELGRDMRKIKNIVAK